MSKHARTTLVLDRQQQAPKHSEGWTPEALFADQWPGIAKDLVPAAYHPYTPGKHAKPFGKHHTAQPVTEATTTNVTPLRKQHTQAPTGCQICDDLDVAA